jgi:hypothetical protein
MCLNFTSLKKILHCYTVGKEPEPHQNYHSEPEPNKNDDAAPQHWYFRSGWNGHKNICCFAAILKGNEKLKQKEARNNCFVLTSKRNENFRAKTKIKYRFFSLRFEAK